MSAPSRDTLTWARLGTVLILACSNPPVSAVLNEVPDLVVIDTDLRPGASVQVRLENDTDRPVRFEAPACRIAFERLVFDTWAPVPGEGACTGEPVVLAPAAAFAFLVELPGGAGRYRMLLEGSQEGAPFLARSPPFDVRP